MKNNLFVFDTNILLSALLDNNSVPAQALRLARQNGTLLISDETALEYLQVFAREKFDRYVPVSLRFIFIENIISNALPVIIKHPVKACRDKRDDMFLSVAVNGKADCIISGDKDLLSMHPFEGIRILKPVDFVNDHLNNK